MSKTVELLLTENVEALGIVGDVVRVRSGYARNYLLPRSMATPPSEEKIRALAQKRAEAERELAVLRADREKLIEKIEGFEITLQRSCNDQGLLYGSVTQRDIADALAEAGFDIRPRDVRLPHTIKRVDTYEVHIKLDQDLAANVKLWVVPDRDLAIEERDELEFDEEGNLIEKKGAPAASRETADRPASA